MTYVDLACTKAAFVKDTTPSTNYHGATQYQLAGPQASTSYGGNRLLLAFEELQGQYRYRRIYGMSFKLPISRNVQSSPYVYVHALDEAFDETTVTWETQPRSSKYFYEGAKPSDGSGDEVLSITPYLSSKKDDYSEASLFAVKAPGFYIRTGGSIYNPSYFVDAYTDAAAAGKRPYLHVSLSDIPATVETELTYPIHYTDTFDHSKPVTFTWKSDFVGRGSVGFTEPVAPIVQTGATLYWKESDSEGPYNVIQISGSEESYTFPANALPARNVTWYVEATFEGYSGGRSGNGFAAPRIYVDLPAQDLVGVSSLQPDSTLPWAGSDVVIKFNHFTVPDQYKYLLAQFGSFPTASERLAAVKSGIVCATFISAGQRQGLIAYALASRFDSQSVTWNTKPSADALHSGGYYDNSAGTGVVSIPEFFSLFAHDPGTDVTKATSAAAVAAVSAPAFQLQPFASIKPEGATDWEDTFSVREPVVLRVILLDQTVTSKPSALTNASGYVNPHVAQAFRWQHVPDGDYWCVAGWTTRSATLYWRQAGASTWNSVAAAAGSSAVILPAETMSAGSVEWYVTATDDQGTTASSDVYTINTQDGLHTATPITPDGSLENGDAAIRFVWSDSSDTGAAPGGADLAYSDDDGTTWTTFAQPRTSATQYDAPGDTLPSGAVSWRVRSINAEGTAGEWSSPLSFLCFASPDAPIVTADGKPLLTVTWQSAEQQAYEITVDGVKHGPYFGTSKSWQAPDYLADGSHSVSIRVQNEYGLWSDPGEITVTVVNQPGAPITLSGLFNRDAELRWATENNTGNYLIYRDDVRIGHAGSTFFTDRTCLGYHAWKVFAVLPDGYYTASNIVNGELSTGCPTIAALNGGGWIDLKLSSSSDRSMMWNHNQSVTMRQFAGREYPDVEVAPYRSTSVSFDVAWTYSEADLAAAFANLVGRPVILKTSCEGVLVGILSAWQRENTQFFKAYTCTVQRINWRDYTDADS